MIASEAIAQSAPATDTVDARGSLLIGTLLYVSTTAYARNTLLLLIFPLTWRAWGHFRSTRGAWLVIAFSTTAVLFALGALGTGHTADVSSLTVVCVALSAASVRSFGDRAWKLFVVLTFVEVLVGVAEYAKGVNTFLPSLAIEELGDGNLYQERVFGLSANSSGLADKVFMSVLLVSLFWKTLPAKHKMASVALLAAGLYVTFNRTAIVASAVFLYVSALSSVRSRFLRIACLAAPFLVVMLLPGIFESVFLVFSRNSPELFGNEAKRLEYWHQAAEFISEHPLFGNFSAKYGVFSSSFDHLVHAHNSFLMLLATHGVLVSTLLLGYVAVMATRSSAIYLVGIAVFSLTQYFVFWNLSVADMFLFWILQRFRDVRTAPTPATEYAGGIHQ